MSDINSIRKRLVSVSPKKKIVEEDEKTPEKPVEEQEDEKIEEAAFGSNEVSMKDVAELSSRDEKLIRMILAQIADIHKNTKNITRENVISFANNKVIANDPTGILEMLGKETTHFMASMSYLANRKLKK